MHGMPESQTRTAASAGLIPWRRLLTARVVASSTLAADAEPPAYVPNEGSSTATVIDTSTAEVMGEIATGGKPHGFVATISVGQRPGARRSRRTGPALIACGRSGARCR